MKKHYGFTLIELMITIAIAAIVMTIAVPSFNTTIQNNRITTQTNDLISAINLARMEAIHRGANVSLCASSDQATCSGTNDWSVGWIVYEDTVAVGTTTTMASGGLIRVWRAMEGSPTVTASNSATFIRYNANGTLGASRIITHKITGCTDTQKRIISISAAGRPNSRPASC
ncbi:MAG: GspH/FimT family pseudopilin [Gammaproteobacteria bacterium]